MAALTRAQLIQQTRVLIGDAFPGSYRYTEEQVLKALQFAQVQACSLLGLSYTEATRAVIQKLVLIPTDAIRVQHVRIGEAVEDFSLRFALESGGVWTPVTGPVVIPIDPLARQSCRLEIVREGTHDDVVTVAPISAGFDSNVVVYFDNSDSWGTGFPTLSIGIGDPQTVISDFSSNGPIPYEITFVVGADDEHGHHREATLTFQPIGD